MLCLLELVSQDFRRCRTSTEIQTAGDLQGQLPVLQLTGILKRPNEEVETGIEVHSFQPV